MRALLLTSLALIGTTRADDDLARAREAFRKEVAVAYDVAAEKITVHPMHPGLPDNTYDTLKTGPWFAVRADIPGPDPGPRGFATADGKTAHGKAFHGGAALLDSMRELPAAEIVRRLMWMNLPGTSSRLIDGHPQHAEVVPPAIDSTGGNFTLTWFVEKAGNTGVVQIFRFQYTALKDKPITLKQHALK